MGPVWKDELTSLAAEPPAGQLNPTNDKVYDVSVCYLVLLIFSSQIHFSNNSIAMCKIYQCFRKARPLQ
jgi:hypothetical protein